MDINNQDNFSQLINLSLLTTFYTQLKNQFVLIDNYNDFYNSVNQKIQENTKNIDDIKINLNNNYYTKDDIDSEFDLLNQGIMTNYYSKTDIDSKIIVINNNINNLSQNLNNNYYNKTYIDNNFLSLSGGTLQGNLTAPTFIGNLNGNANTSSLANKVSNKLIFTGGFVGEYDGSSELNVIIPTSGATKGILTIQLNGGTTEDVDKITFNGATNKSINITPESIGAITQSILNNYLPLTGGTLTGSLTAPIFNGDLNGNATSASKVNNKLTFSGYQSSIYDGSSDISITIPNLLSQLTNDTNFATISYVDSKVSSVYKFKGSVENYSDLPTSGNEVGDVWDIINADPTNNIKAGDNVVWTGTTWDNLGGITDLSNYYNKSEIDNKLTTINQSISNINNNLISNYYTKTNIDNKLNEYLPLTGGTLSGQLTATRFNGNLNGNATSSTTATKVSNKLIFTGAVNSTYDGSKEITVNIPTQLEGDYLPLSGGTLTGNLNSRSIIPTSNSTYNLGSSTYKYNIVYANTFNGNATSSSTASKVANKLTFTGASTGTYDGSSAITINIPEFQQTNGILTIQLNGGNVEGSNKFTFNGSVNKTVDITPSSIGAVTSSELNNYLSLLGGTINGNLYVNGTITANNLNGDLNGNATSANKVNNKLSFIGYQTKSYDGSQAVEIEIPDKTSQLTNDSNFATTDYVDNKEFVGLNKDSIIRYPKDLPIPEGYELVEEQFSALTDANNELILQAPLTAPQNLLINGNFKINQRGQALYRSTPTSASLTVDCWRIGGQAELTVNDDNVILSATGSGESYLAQHIDKDLTGKKLSVAVKVRYDKVYTGTITVTDVETVFISDGQWMTVSAKYDPNRNGTQLYINVAGGHSYSFEYVDAFEGEIIYSHVEEDDGIALMRCQQYLRAGYYIGACIYSYSSGKKLFSFCYENMKSAVTAKLNINYYTDEGLPYETTNYSIDVILNGRVTFTLNDTTDNAIQNGPVRIYAELSCEPL